MSDNKKIEEEKNEDKFTLKEFIIYTLIIVLIILFKMFVATPILVSGASMEATLSNKDVLILNKMTYRFNDIKRFDIVVVDDGSENIIKRVIGLPGEKVEYINNELYINGKKIKENYNHMKTEDFEFVVPDNEYFVLGDNRGVSVDSRILGTFSKREILGKANLVIFPFSKFGFKS